jgi:transcriptional regulator with XRE-family HTH domain
MSEAGAGFPDIDQHVAVNLRALRERGGLSQDEVARRVSERGFGFTQATIWKIESGQRPVRVSEAVALSEALELPRWHDLTEEPETSRHHAELTQANRRALQAHSALKAAAAAFLEAQLHVSLAVRHARDDGIAISQLHTSWLDIPAEQAVIEARVESAGQDESRQREFDEVSAIMAVLREHGHAPPRPEDWVVAGGDSAPPTA